MSQRFAASQPAGFYDVSHVPLAAAHEVNGAISRDPRGIAQCVSQELDIFRTSHFACRRKNRVAELMANPTTSSAPPKKSSSLETWNKNSTEPKMATMGMIGPSGSWNREPPGSRVRHTRMAMQVEMYCTTTATLLTSASLSKPRVAPRPAASTETEMS